jgi:hypothetical protein
MVLPGLQLALVELGPVEQGVFFNIVLVGNLDLDIDESTCGGTAQDIQTGIFVAEKVGVNFPVKEFNAGKLLTRLGFEHGV